MPAKRSGRIQGRDTKGTYGHGPTVCAILAGLNKSETLGQTLAWLWGTNPRMEMIVVIDGSDDGMAEVARQFARRQSSSRQEHPPAPARPHQHSPPPANPRHARFSEAEYLVPDQAIFGGFFRG